MWLLTISILNPISHSKRVAMSTNLELYLIHLIITDGWLKFFALRVLYTRKNVSSFTLNSSKCYKGAGKICLNVFKTYTPFTCSENYPFDSPEVTFIGSNIPIHPHIYSNGHICLSILTDDWSPALSVQSVCLSILSMLASCREKKRPPDNTFYVRTCSKNPKKTKWFYHDDTV